MENPYIIKHPLIQHKTSLLREKNTNSKEFRELISEISMLMCYEATRDLPLKEVEIETPMTEAKVKFISGKKLAFIPILRAGLGMEQGMTYLVPNAKIGHIGVYRDPQSLESFDYYCKLPADISKRDVIVLDPMLATGNSLLKTIDILKKNNVQNIKFMCIIASETGVNNIIKHHPEIKIYCAALDKKLDEKGYIIPGCGDAGNRIFGTK